MAKPTHLTRLTAQNIRVGGVPGSLKGAQPVMPGRVPSNWYPMNLPAASNGTPTNADCLTLLNTLRPILADLVVQQSVLLALSYRTVQSVAVQANAPFTVNGVTATGNSMFDGSVNLSESVPVDVVNKNPALAYDLAVRLAQQAAYKIDRMLAAMYGQFNANAVVGTAAQGTIVSADIATAITAIGATGEPLFLITQANPANTVPALAGVGSSFQSDNPAAPGNGVFFAQTAAGVIPVRVIGSTAVVHTGGGSPSEHNLLLTPSALAFATTDMGTTPGAAPGITPTGTVQYATSIARDPEFATPQLALQLVIGNSGTGNQRVYVNFLGTAVLANNARGVQVTS